MGTLIDYDYLDSLWKDSDRPVIGGESPISWADFTSKVQRISSALKKRDEKEWLLYTDGADSFLIGLYSLLAASKDVHIPGILADDASLPLLTDRAGQENTLALLEENGSDEAISLDDSDSVIVFYTSGSTGVPKKIEKSLRQICNELSVLKGRWGSEIGDTVVYSTVSHQHFYGMLFAVSLPLVSGATMWEKKVQFPESLHALPEGGKTLISSPAFLKRLEDMGHADFDNSFRFFSSGGFLPPSAAKHAKALFGRDVTEIYGSTETGGIATRRSPRESEWTPLETVSLDIAETGCRIRSSYLATEDWEELGDILEWGKDGGILLHGRADSIVKVEEKRISLREMENCLAGHPWVNDCCVLYFQEKRQYLGAVVALDGKVASQWEGLKKLEINRELRRFLAPHFHPTLLPKKWRYPHELPRNSMAKLNKEKVMALFEEKKLICDEPEILSRERTDSTWNYRLLFPENYRYFEGHFPEMKILPALAQINWILLELEKETEKKVVLDSLPRIKFKNPVFPGRVMDVKFAYNEEKRTVTFSFSDGESGMSCSSGKIILGEYPMAVEEKTFKPCAVVPVYNHGSTTRGVVLSLGEYGLPVILVDDGSDKETENTLKEITAEIPDCHLFRLECNQGKGGAVMRGLQEAEKLGFTHALQVDSDGQHDVSSVETFINSARENPESLIAGYPVYDESVPTARRVGRKLTTAMVSLETLSRDIVDAMCGFRMYPVGSCCRLIESSRLGKRMEFDIQFLVKLHWRGGPMIFHPVRVIYPEGGISHFRMFRDNAMISKMHTLLVIGMIFRLPLLLARKVKRK